MKRKPLILIAVSLLVILALFIGLRQYLRRPSPWQRGVLAAVTLRIQSTGVDPDLNDELAGITDYIPVYVAAVVPGARERQYQIVAANFKGAVGLTLEAFWDQQSSWYASAGPVIGPTGETYMIYVSR